MAHYDQALDGLSVEELYKLINDPTTTRGLRIRARARVKAMSNVGNRVVRRSWVD